MVAFGDKWWGALEHHRETKMYNVDETYGVKERRYKDYIYMNPFV